jgi:hypothetical protein
MAVLLRATPSTARIDPVIRWRLRVFCDDLRSWWLISVLCGEAEFEAG